MFDITSFVREKIFRRPKLGTALAGEELSEKQTTKMGYFLLYCMFGAIMASAQWTLSIIKEIPTVPTPVPSCAIRILDAFDIKHDTYKNNDYYDNVYYYESNYGYAPNEEKCPLTANHPAFDLSTEYNALKEPYTNIVDYKEAIRKLESEKDTLGYTQDSTQKDYDTALTEKMAGEKVQVYDPQEIKTDLRTSRAQMATITSQIAEQKSALASVKSRYNQQAIALKEKIDAADADYRSAYLLYRLYIALLSFAFSLTVFAVLYKMYVRQKIKNSPHTVIFSVATFAYGLIVVQVAGLLCWDFIPHTVLEALLNFLKNFSAVLYLVQFLWPLVIVAIFGYLVFRIQKRLYSPQNVLKRFVADKKCPHCGNGVDITKPFCPLCSHEIQIRCETCHEFTLK